MILVNLKRLAYCMAWVISVAMTAPLLAFALPLGLIAMALARSSNTTYVAKDPGPGGKLLRWVYGWRFADRYLQWAAKITGIYH